MPLIMSGKRPAETIQTLLEAESEAKLVVEKARKGTYRAPVDEVGTTNCSLFLGPLVCGTMYGSRLSLAECRC